MKTLNIKNIPFVFFAICMYTYANWSRMTSYQSQGRTPIARKKAKILTQTITRSRSPQTWPTAFSTGLEWPRGTQHKRFLLEQCFGYRKKRCSQILVCNVLAFCSLRSLLTANTRHCTTYTHFLLQVKTCCFLRKANVLAGWLCGTWSTHLSNMR